MRSDVGAVGVGLANLHLVCQVRGEGRSVRVGLREELAPERPQHSHGLIG
jgi:hypothetical protein